MARHFGTALRSGAIALAALAISACDPAGSAAGGGPGGVSEGEARALDEAASMLDEKRLPEGALPDVDPPATPAENTTENGTPE